MRVRAGSAPQALERNWRSIRDEALAVMDQRSGLFVPEEENLRERGEWGQYTLWQQGGPRKICSWISSSPMLLLTVGL